MSGCSKKRSLEAADIDTWKYQVVNNVKILHNTNDVPHFITSVCRIWKIDQYLHGKDFIDHFCSPIRDWRKAYLNGFEYIKENNDKCYCLLYVKPHRDGRSTEVIYTNHTLSRSSGNQRDNNEVSVEEHTALSWLKERACKELNLSNEAKDHLLNKTTNYPTINTLQYKKCPVVEKKLLTKYEMELIMQENTPEAPYQVWRYASINRTEPCRSVLEDISEIFEYSQRCGWSEQFLKHLENEIQNLQNCHQVSYSFVDGIKLRVLCIVMGVVNKNTIEMACRLYG